MNFPTSDTQFLAEMILRTRAGDQITAQETHRLEEIAQVGHSRHPVADVDTRVYADATRVQR